MTIVIIIECCIFPYICWEKVCNHVYVYVCIHTCKICGLTCVGVKSEVVNRFPSHIHLELCATPVPFGSMFSSFHISIDTDLSHQKVSCSKETTFWPVIVMQSVIKKTKHASCKICQGALRYKLFFQVMWRQANKIKIQKVLISSMGELF